MSATQRGNRSRWKEIAKPGRGGQGTVFKVIDKQTVDPLAKKVETLAVELRNIAANIGDAHAQEKARDVAEMLRHTVGSGELASVGHCGALKVLHPAEDNAEFQKALERMRNEIAAYEAIADSSLLKVLDKNLDECWLVTEFHAGGT